MSVIEVDGPHVYSKECARPTIPRIPLILPQ
jgi:hypothetical protein